MRAVNLVGQRFGRLVVLDRAENDKHGRSQWLCKCDCGNTHVVKNGNLRDGVSSSCGCQRREHARRVGKAMAGEASPRWKGGPNTPRAKCARALLASNKPSVRKRQGESYIGCTATIDELIPTVVDHCELCGIGESELKKSLCLDHDHKTGKFRGWLCDRCNVTIVGVIDTHLDRVLAYFDRKHISHTGESLNDCR